jgi:hypothetical protein
MAEEVLREAGIFRFYNRTRYSSDDIIHIFRVMEATAIEQGASKETPLKLDQYRVESGMVYDFGDYNPAESQRTESTWENGNRVSKTVLNCVNGPGYSASTRWKINLLPPHRIHTNPIEALTADQTYAPSEMTTQLTGAIMGLFRPDFVDWQRVNVWRERVYEKLTGGPNPHLIRINAKRESPTQSSTRKNRVALGMARVCFMNTREGFREAINALTIACRRSADLEEHLRGTDIVAPVSAAEVAEVIRKVDEILGRLESCEALEIRC